MKVLMVCTANRFRSPSMEIIAKHKWPGLEVKGAGAGEKAEDGKKMSSKMLGLLQEKGYIPEMILSRRITQADVDWADKILYCQPSHAESIESRFEVKKNQLINLASFENETKIPDPAFLSDIGDCFSVVCMIERCLEKFMEAHG